MTLKHRLGNFFIVVGVMGVMLFIASVLARTNYDVVSLLWGAGLIALGVNWSLSQAPTGKPAPPKPAPKPPPPPAAPKAAKPSPLATLFKGPKKATPPPEPLPPPPPPPKPKGLAALFPPREKK